MHPPKGQTGLILMESHDSKSGECAMLQIVSSSIYVALEAGCCEFMSKPFYTRIQASSPSFGGVLRLEAELIVHGFLLAPFLMILSKAKRSYTAYAKETRGHHPAQLDCSRGEGTPALDIIWVTLSAWTNGAFYHWYCPTDGPSLTCAFAFHHGRHCTKRY